MPTGKIELVPRQGRSLQATDSYPSETAVDSHSSQASSHSQMRKANSMHSATSSSNNDFIENIEELGDQRAAPIDTIDNLEIPSINSQARHKKSDANEDADRFEA